MDEIEGYWAKVSELARLRGVSTAAISRRVSRYEALGLLKTRPGNARSKLVNVAEFDRIAGTTTVRDRNVAGSPPPPLVDTRSRWGDDRRPHLEAGGNEAWVNIAHSERRRFVAYYRVSTRQQGRSGLGLEAQRSAVANFLAANRGELFADFTEVESGTKSDRPQFMEALRICRVYSAILVIAKLDRLARNVALTSALMEGEVEFVAADFPQANRLTIHILAAIAEYEAKLISERIKAAIVVSKARGVVWGGNKHAPTGHLDAARIKGNERRARRLKARAIDLAPLIIGLRERGMSLAKTAGELTRLRVRTTSGKTIWTESTVRRLLIRSADQFPDRGKWNRSKQRYE
jgi:DNA invertase Pin-like site-specific DNA recombinase